MRPIIKKLILGATAGNVVGVLTNDTKMDLELLFGEVITTTDATVASRLVNIDVCLADGTVEYGIRGVVANTASLVTRNQFIQAVSREAALGNGSVIVGIPERLVIPGGGTLKIAIVAGVATDTYTARFTAKEAIA